MSKTYHKIIMGHNGALGDFCCIFPALAAVREHFFSCPVRWAGAGGRTLWLDPLKITPALPEEQRAIRRLYTSATWPEALDGALVLFFVLDKNPFPEHWPDLWVIRGVDTSWKSPRVLAREQLQARGVAWPVDWRHQWSVFYQQAYGAGKLRETMREVLLFPGAGHQAKQWPLVKFFELAEWLEKQRLKPVLVLGPAEQERGMRPEMHGALEIRRFQTPEELTDALVNARAVCGNDCGPMHLASLVRTPGLVLFGPTSRRQWAPSGLGTLAQDLPCRPCTRTTRSLSCDTPRCITELPVPAVIQALERVLGGDQVQELWKPE